MLIAVASGGSLTPYLVGIACLVIAVWALVDAFLRPGRSFRAAGQNKALWIALPIIGLALFVVVGGLIGAFYLLAVRPKIPINR